MRISKSNSGLVRLPPQTRTRLCAGQCAHGGRVQPRAGAQRCPPGPAAGQRTGEWREGDGLFFLLDDSLFLCRSAPSPSTTAGCRRMWQRGWALSLAVTLFSSPTEICAWDKRTGRSLSASTSLWTSPRRSPSSSSGLAATACDVRAEGWGD